MLVENMVGPKWTLLLTIVHYSIWIPVILYIGVAYCFGFVQTACDVVLHKYKEKDEHKPVDAERFTTFVREKLVPVLGNYERKELRSVVIMDNCKIHVDPEIRRMIYSAGAIIIYSAPYCPDVIPIEFMFSQ